MYGKGGLTSLREARTVLERHAPRGEFLAYINSDEAALLKSRGGSGEVVNESGIKSYRSLRKTFNKLIPKEVTRTLDKIVPNEIKPFLPYIAAAVPFLLPTTGLFASSMARALAGAGANAFSQLSQEGAEKYGINPISVGLSGLSGYLSGPGTGADLASGKIVGNVPTNIQSGISNISGIDDLAQLGYAGTSPVTQGMITAGQGIPTSTDLSLLQKAENVARGIGEYGAETFQKGQTAFDKIASGDIMDVSLGDVGNIAKAAGPSVLGAAGDQAYLDASKALEEYNKQQQAMGQLGVANTEARKAAIRRAMGLSGYTPEEIENTILKFKFADGGRVGYQEGGFTDYLSNPLYQSFLQSPFYQTGVGTTAMTSVTLPSGETLMLPGSLSANQFKEYLASTPAGGAPVGIPTPVIQNREETLEEAMTRGENFFDPIGGFQVNPLTGGRMGTGIDPNFMAQRAMQAEQDAASRTSPVNVISRGVPSNFLSPNQSMQQELLMRQGAVQTGGTSRSASEGSTGISPLFAINRLIQAEQDAAARVTPKMADGGLMNLRMGGMPAEMDLRAKGGFVPIGRKERADDVPARLSKNEFVFTAKAVRNAGGGDVRKGAKRMYQIMNQLEARS
jgi:hypothetical protein